MNPLRKTALIGGDERSAVCADLVAKSGVECAVYGLEKSTSINFATKAASLRDALCGCDILILPLPVMNDSACIFSPLSERKIPLSEIIGNISDETIIFAGNPQKCFFSALDAEKRKNDIVNYAKSDLFAVLGSVPTAEGAVIEAIKATGKTISSSHILIAGCGKVGKQLALLLKSMNAKVTVSARKPLDLAFIESNGMKAIKTADIGLCGKNFDIIFNTVPTMIFDENVLKALSRSPVIIELASKPYGAGLKKSACRSTKKLPLPKGSFE